MAGFRIGRRRDQGADPRSGHPQQQGGYPSPYGQQQYAPQPTYGRQPYAQATGPGSGSGSGGPTGEPEYFGAPAGPAPSYNDNPGHTRAFSIGEGPGAYGHPGGHDDGYEDSAYANTYRAGQTTGPPSGPRLGWKQLLSGIFLRPAPTFWQMRDYQVWGPALLVTFVYGLLAVFGFGEAREDVLNATLGNSIPWVLSTAVAVVLMGLMLGSVTNALARQLGGDGAWAPTVGLSMLITSLTDAPRLLFAMFLASGNTFVQVLGWLTWLACGALLTSMVSKSHDLPWPKALGAASIQLIALLVLIKLPVL